MMDQGEELIKFIAGKTGNKDRIPYHGRMINLKNKWNLNETIRLIQRDTRRYAKRQLTWFRRDKRIKWIIVAENTDIGLVVDQIKEEARV